MAFFFSCPITLDAGINKNSDLLVVLDQWARSFQANQALNSARLTAIFLFDLLRPLSVPFDNVPPVCVCLQNVVWALWSSLRTRMKIVRNVPADLRELTCFSGSFELLLKLLQIFLYPPSWPLLFISCWRPLLSLSASIYYLLSLLRPLRPLSYSSPSPSL